MKVKVKGPKTLDIKRDTAEYFHPAPLCDKQFCMTVWRDERIHRQVAQLTPRCPACAEPYMIEVDGSNVKDVTPGQISTGKCEKCGREFKYILFRSYYEENPDDPVFNGFTIKEEVK